MAQNYSTASHGAITTGALPKRSTWDHALSRFIAGNRRQVAGFPRARYPQVKHMFEEKLVLV